MKRIISLILVLIMLMSSVVFLPTVSTADGTAGKGDVNEDGVVSIKDSLVLRKYMSAVYDPDDEDLFRDIADINSDGKVNSKDARFLKLYLVCEIATIAEAKDYTVPEHPTVTIGGVNLQNFIITFPDEYVEPGWAVDADGVYQTEVNVVHYSARSLRAFINNFFDGSFGSANITKYSQIQSGKNYIYLVVDETGDYGKDGYNIKTENGNVYITASASRGMVYGTTDFMENYLQGKFYSSQYGNYEDCENGFDIPMGIDDTQICPFDYRCIVGYTTAMTSATSGGYGGHSYNSRRKINGYSSGADYTGTNYKSFGYSIGRFGEFNAHSIYPYVCRTKKYDKYTDSQDPKVQAEKATLVDSSPTPCLYENCTCDNTKSIISGNKVDIYNAVIEDIQLEINTIAEQKGLTTIQQIKDYPSDLQVSCSMQDNNKVCTCSSCMAVYREYGTFNAVYFDFLNRVADHFYEIYGDSIKLFSILYDRTYPEKFFENADNLPRSNMILCYCLSGCNNHTLDGEGCKQANLASCVTQVASVQPNINSASERLYENGNGTNIGELDRIKKFGQLSNTLEAQSPTNSAFDFYIWYYPTNVHYYVCPSPNYFNILKDMRLLADAGVDGIYFESDNDNYAFEELRDYLASEAMWNPYMSEAEYEVLMDRWLEYKCGDGWRYVKKYILMNEEASNRMTCWVNNYDGPWAMVSRNYYKENYPEMKRLFDSAENFAGDNTPEQAFIKAARVHCDFLGLSARFDEHHNDSDYRAAYLNMYNYIKNSTTNYYEDGVKTKPFALGGTAFTIPSSINYNQNPMCWYYAYAGESCPGTSSMRPGDYYR